MSNQIWVDNVLRRYLGYVVDHFDGRRHNPQVDVADDDCLIYAAAVDVDVAYRAA
jgi:hypothetical protein